MQHSSHIISIEQCTKLKIASRHSGISYYSFSVNNKTYFIKAYSGNDPATKNAFKTEINRMSNFANAPKGLPTYYPDFKIIEPGYDTIVVMDYIEGQTLEDYLRETTTLRLEQYHRIMSQINTFISYLGNHKIYYTDVNPSNFIITNPETFQLSLIDHTNSFYDGDMDIDDDNNQIHLPSNRIQRTIDNENPDKLIIRTTADLFSTLIYKINNGYFPDAGYRRNIRCKLKKIFQKEPPFPLTKIYLLEGKTEVSPTDYDVFFDKYPTYYKYMEELLSYINYSNNK